MSEFYLDDTPQRIESGRVSGNMLVLKLKEPSTAEKITYLKETSWNQKRLLVGRNSIAALTFKAVTVSPPAESDPAAIRGRK